MGRAALALLALPLLLALRLPPPTPASVSGPARPLGAIVRTPQFIVACTAGVVSYGLMAFLMTATEVLTTSCGWGTGTASTAGGLTAVTGALTTAPELSFRILVLFFKVIFFSCSGALVF